MYGPNHFKEGDAGKLQQTIRDYGFGLLIVSYDEEIEANHVPFQLSCEEEGSLGRLHCRLARSNPAGQRLGNGARVLVMPQGLDAYVSPSWYPTKAETGRVVPSWNYHAVHAQGHSRAIEDVSWLKRHVRQLTDQHESGRDNPWSVDGAPSDSTERLVQAIVGVEIEIEILIGKLKASQNQPERNRAAVKTSLDGGVVAHSWAMSRLID